MTASRFSRACWSARGSFRSITASLNFEVCNSYAGTSRRSRCSFPSLHPHRCLNHASCRARQLARDTGRGSKGAWMCKKELILCVDDEENQLAVRKLVLESKGYDVLTAASGRQALGLLAQHQVDLVLSDHLMPGLTGADLARQIKAQMP